MLDNPKTIEYLKSGLSLQTHIGCRLGCKYCIVESFYDDVNRLVTEITDPESLVKELLTHKYYSENIPLLINNKTEALQGGVKDSTYRILELLKEFNVKNPKILITKLPVMFDEYEALNQNNLFIFTTYSGMPKEIEKTSNDVNLKHISACNKRLREETDAKLIHYFRPIVRNINTSDEILTKVIDFAHKNFDCSIVSGVRITPPIKDVFEQHGADFSDWNYDIEHKFLPMDIFERIKEIKNSISEDYLIFKKTSCSISYFNGKSDYNRHYINTVKADCENCQNYKRCQEKPRINKKYVVEILDNLDLANKYDLEGDRLLIKRTLDQETVSFLKHSTGCDIMVNKKLRSDTEEMFYEKNRFSS